MLPRFFLLLIYCGLLSGCSGGVKTQLIVENSPEFRTAITIDLVTARADIALRLENIKATDWFQNRDALTLQYSDNLAIHTLQLVPGYSGKDIEWGKVSGKKPHYFAFVNWGHKAKRYMFAETIPKHLLLGTTNLKTELPAVN